MGYGFNPLVGDGAPVINATLSDDLYKFTLNQFVFKLHPGVPVVSAFQNRAKSVRLAEVVDEKDLRRELDHVRSLRMRPDEIDYMAGLRFVNHSMQYVPGEAKYQRVFCDEYLDFLRTLELPAYQLSVTPEGQFDLKFPGPWEKQSYWECPAMRIVNTLRVRAMLRQMSRAEQDQLYRNALERLHEKIAFFKAHPWIKFVEFGFRRAGTPEWHDEVDTILFKSLPPSQIVGVSEVSAARRHRTPNSGTFPHEGPMVYSGIYYDLDERAGTMESHQRFFRDWVDFYKGELSLMLTDTYGSRYAFKHFPKELVGICMGLRQDSGSPIAYLDLAEKFYKKNSVATNTKRVVPSDSLNPQVIHEIDSANRGRFSLVNGYGTNLTFDFSNENGYSPIPAISIVVKAVEACGHELGKLTDNFAKANGSPATIARLRRLTGNLADTASSELRS